VEETVVGWGRAFCWLGAVVDAIATIALLSPALSSRMLGVEGVPVTPALSYAMRTGAALMAGWTCLLLWASVRPRERAGVILLTVVPVVLGLMATELAAIAEGFITAPNVAPLLVMQAGIAALGVWAYRKEVLRAR
jgi:hypothetical protein